MCLRVGLFDLSELALHIFEFVFVSLMIVCIVILHDAEVLRRSRMSASRFALLSQASV